MAASTAVFELIQDLKLIPVGSPKITPAPRPLSCAERPRENAPNNRIVIDFLMFLFLDVDFQLTEVENIKNQ